MIEKRSLHVVFVCLGNICRSPAAQGILESLIENSELKGRVTVDSCGTAAFNTGKTPDPRSIVACERAGYDIASQIARQIDDEDYQKADYLIPMDRSNLSSVQAWAPADFKGEIRLFMEYVPHGGISQIPDPYYKDAEQFDSVITMLEQAARGLFSTIKQRLSST